MAEHSVPYVAFGGCTDTENCGTQFALLCASRVVPGDVCDSELLKQMLQQYVRLCLHTWQSWLSPPPSHICSLVGWCRRSIDTNPRMCCTWLHKPASGTVHVALPVGLQLTCPRCTCMSQILQGPPNGLCSQQFAVLCSLAAGRCHCLLHPAFNPHAHTLASNPCPRLVATPGHRCSAKV